MMIDEDNEYERPLDEPVPVPEQTRSGSWQTAVRSAVDAFVASTGDSTKQLSVAAEAFAGETMRLMENAAATIEASLSRNAELAQTAERAADEARNAAADAAETALAEATARFSTEAQRYLDQMSASMEQSVSRDSDLAGMFERAVEEARNAVEEHIQTSVQSLSDRLAAESRSRLVEVGASARETEDRLSQLVQTAEKSVSEAMAAASAAEAAATRAAADFEAKTAGLVDELAARVAAERGDTEPSAAAPNVDFDALSRKIEDAIARASDLALSAETAAAAARAAAEEARYNAEQSQGARNEAWTPDAGPVLDRLEADYSLLTQVVRELNDRITSLSLISTPASEPVDETPPLSFPVAHLVEDAPIGEEPANEESYEDDAPPAYEPVYLYGAGPAPEVTAEATAEPESAETPAAEPDYYGLGAATPAAEEVAEVDAEEAPTSPWDLPAWSSVETPVAEAEPVESTPIAEIEPAPIVHLWTPPEASEEAPLASDPYAESEPMEPVASIADYETDETETPVAEAETAEPVTTPYAWAIETPAEEVMAEVIDETPVAEEPVAEPVMAGASERIEGRVTLNVSPITDFDRLLSLDGALGRLPVVVNVTLADYARDEVTFRIELGQPVSVADFARDLSETAGQPIEPVSVADGHVKLHFTGMAA